MARLNPAQLEIELFTAGVRLASGREVLNTLIHRTRAGLGSGIEAILPAAKPIWINIPVVESFTAQSPFVLQIEPPVNVTDERNGERYPIRLAPRPDWYDARTGSGKLMSRIGVLQGTCLAVYIGDTCEFWRDGQEARCGFCTTGLNLGRDEERRKSIRDVVEVARRAKQESGITFVHFNSGHHSDVGLELAAPYVKAIKEEVGALVGIQLTPDTDLWKYDELIGLGVDHFSFCYELQDPHAFATHLPGKHSRIGQEAYFNALRHVSAKMNRGSCSGEIIAGLEPIEKTYAAVDMITTMGAFPTICIFRPLVGARLEGAPAPSAQEMTPLFEYMIEACMRHSVPIGLAPNLEVSLVVLPTDALYLAPDTSRFRWYRRRLKWLRLAAKPYFLWRMRTHRHSGKGSELLRLARERLPAWIWD
ncbi:hypothetical protein JW905_14190 [bacterium]|nr:hypothetical protein [candidate division CSSED10-310 bacterium]